MSVFTNSSVVKTQIEAFRGAQGPAGPQGIQGIPGVQGPAGSDGRDGVSPTITLTREADGVRITTTDASGTHSEMVYDGQDGQGGGSGGANINDTTPSTNTTYSSSKINELLNEQKEAIDGKLNASALPTAIDTALAQAKESGEFKGDKGDKGDTGEIGPAGADGKTPAKGTDYWTEADQQQIVSDVLAALPTWEGGSY